MGDGTDGVDGFPDGPRAPSKSRSTKLGVLWHARYAGVLWSHSYRGRTARPWRAACCHRSRLAVETQQVRTHAHGYERRCGTPVPPAPPALSPYACCAARGPGPLGIAAPSSAPSAVSLASPALPLHRVPLKPALPPSSALLQWQRGIVNRLPRLRTVPHNYTELWSFVQAIELALQALDRPADAFQNTTRQLHPLLQTHRRMCMGAYPDPTRQA
ncbi:hypothetical protein ACSSS7_003293 [Eimeria intestinalis]